MFWCRVIVYSVTLDTSVKTGRTLMRQKFSRLISWFEDACSWRSGCVVDFTRLP